MSKFNSVRPYYFHAGGIIDRLRWDLNYKSFVSRSRLKRLKNVYQGKKALILCNGPSLNKVNFNQLKKSGISTFGLNKINLLFDSVDFRPSFIVSVNKHVIEQNIDFFNNTEILLFLKSKSSSIVKLRKNIIFLHAARQVYEFAEDMSCSFCEGFTVTYVAMQLAFHLGFEKVGLVGCDHSFATKGQANKLVDGLEKDVNHFHPNYFGKDVKWQLPDLYQSEAHYNLANERFEMAGRKIFNCTEGGLLEVFDRIKIEKFLADDF